MPDISISIAFVEASSSRVPPISSSTSSIAATGCTESSQAKRKRKTKDEPRKRRQVGQKSNVICKRLAIYFHNELSEYASVSAGLRLTSHPLQSGWASARVVNVIRTITVLIDFDCWRSLPLDDARVQTKLEALELGDILY